MRSALFGMGAAALIAGCNTQAAMDDAGRVTPDVGPHDAAYDCVAMCVTSLMSPCTCTQICGGRSYSSMCSAGQCVCTIDGVEASHYGYTTCAPEPFRTGCDGTSVDAGVDAATSAADAGHDAF